MADTAAVNAAAMATLDAWINRIRSLPDLGKRAAPDVAAMIDDELRRTIGAGQSPDGTPLPKTLEGEVPLTGAGKALNVAAVGGTVYVRLRGVEAAHHLGRVRGGRARQLIPVGGLPPRMAQMAVTIVSKHFADTMGGREADVP